MLKNDSREICFCSQFEDRVGRKNYVLLEMRRLLAEKDDLLEAKDVLLQTAARFALNPSSPRPTVFAQDISYTPSKKQPASPLRSSPRIKRLRMQHLEEKVF